MEHKNYADLTFTDSFMFNKVMLDELICRKVLSLLLGYDIGPLDEIKHEESIQVSAQNKPIRLDIFTKDDKAYYDAEMQNDNKQSRENLALPRRSRYYQSMMDIDAIDKGQEYRNLLNSNVIFICTFDPFGLGLPVYTFTNKCREEPSLELSDGCTKYFFNITANIDKVPNDLKAFFRYTVSKEVTDDLTKEIDSKLDTCRTNEAWRAEYMYWNLLEQDAKAAGREEGREEERAKTAQAILERDNAVAKYDDALAEVNRLKELLAKNGITVE